MSDGVALISGAQRVNIKIIKMIVENMRILLSAYTISDNISRLLAIYVTEDQWANLLIK